MIVRSGRKPGSFFQMSQLPIADERLSYFDIGLLAWVVSKPPNWKVIYETMACAHADAGVYKLRKAIRRLRSFGYCTLYRCIDADGHVVGWDLAMYDDPGLNPHFDPARPPDEQERLTPTLQLTTEQIAEYQALGETPETPNLNQQPGTRNPDRENRDLDEPDRENRDLASGQTYENRDLGSENPDRENRDLINIYSNNSSLPREGARAHAREAEPQQQPVQQTVPGDIGKQPSPRGTTDKLVPSVSRQARQAVRDNPHFTGAKFTREGYVEPCTGTNAVQIYHEYWKILDPNERLTLPMQDDLLAATKQHTLDDIRSVVRESAASGHRPRNISVIIDWLTDPSRRPSNRTQAAPAPAQPGRLPRTAPAAQMAAQQPPELTKEQIEELRMKRRKHAEERKLHQ